MYRIILSTITLILVLYSIIRVNRVIFIDKRVFYRQLGYNAEGITRL